jgi:predicted ATPase
VWTIVSGITFSGQITKGAGVGAIPTMFSVLFSFTIFVLSMRTGAKHLTFTDSLLLFVALGALLPWILTSDPTLSVIIAVGIDLLAFVPTIRKTLHDPSSESVSLYALNSLRHILTLFSLESYNLVTTLHSVVMLITNALMSVLVLRKQSSSSPNNWYVITGGPGTGKTTVINMLAEKGYATVPEMARLHIDEELARGKTHEEMRRDEHVFQREVLRMQLDAEKHLPRTRTTFFDRGVPDTLAYYRFHSLEEDALITKAVAECRYRKIFMLERLPLKPDYARTETEEDQKELVRIIHEVYDSLPFTVIHVPKMSSEKRIAFILNNV